MKRCNSWSLTTARRTQSTSSLRSVTSLLFSCTTRGAEHSSTFWRSYSGLATVSAQQVDAFQHGVYLDERCGGVITPVKGDPPCSVCSPNQTRSLLRRNH